MQNKFRVQKVQMLSRSKEPLCHRETKLLCNVRRQLEKQESAQTVVALRTAASRPRLRAHQCRKFFLLFLPEVELHLLAKTKTKRSKARATLSRQAAHAGLLPIRDRSD